MRAFDHGVTDPVSNCRRPHRGRAFDHGIKDPCCKPGKPGTSAGRFVTTPQDPASPTNSCSRVVMARQKFAREAARAHVGRTASEWRQGPRLLRGNGRGCRSDSSMRHSPMQWEHESWSGLGPISTQKRSDENEHIVIGRLTRRLRISDPPVRFQELATTVLRSSIGVSAVVWAPRNPDEPMIMAGAIEGLEEAEYRSLPMPSGRETMVVWNDRSNERSRKIPHAIVRYAAVSAGLLGCLLAVNPIEDRPFADDEVERMQHVASLIETQLANAKIYADLEELLFGIIRSLSASIDAKDPYTSGHSERVARIAVRLARQLRMPTSKQSDLYLAGLLHDVGKIGIDDDVLKKDGPLTADERRKIQSHVEIGVTILSDLKKLHHILPGVRHHHESYEGNGYPDHLAGDAIPFEARILAVADAFDAMSSNRPYRKRLGRIQIDDIFIKGRGRQWDPKVVDAFFDCRRDVEAIGEKGLGESLIGEVNVALGRS